jgi:hypothetical protein
MEADRRDLIWLAGLGLALLIVLVWPYLIDGYRFGVGPDVPVYLWWTRVGASEGLSMGGSRPGAPALVAALAGTLQLNVTAVTAGLASALGVAAGAASAALVRSASGRRASDRDRPDAPWLLAGGLAGVFSVHLVAGYLANLLLAVAFLAAAAFLAVPRRRWWAAALLLAGGGLAHPPFLVHAIVVLAITAVWAWQAGARDEARDIARSVVVGGLVAGTGVLATIAGPGPIGASTSKDGYLRRAGLDRELVSAYRERFRLRAARYVQWISAPLAVVGVARADGTVEGGFLRRFLASWLAVIAIGVPVGYVTGWLPPDRLVTFGFAVPIAAALGLVWLHRRLAARRWLAWAVVIAFAGWMVVGALLAWGRQAPFVNPREAAIAREAALRAGPPMHLGPIVFIIDDADTTATFLGSRAANILRAASDPDRAGDVFVFVGTVTDFFEGHPTQRGDPEYDALSRLTFADIPDEFQPLVLVLSPFYRGDDAASHPQLVEQGPPVWASRSLPQVSVVADTDPLGFRPSTGVWISLTAFAILTLLTALGLGYARAASDDPIVVFATAPAFGAAAVTLAAVALDRIGLRLESIPVALAASVLGGLGGLAVLLVVQRQRDRRAPA